MASDHDLWKVYVNTQEFFLWEVLSQSTENRRRWDQARRIAERRLDAYVEEVRIAFPHDLLIYDPSKIAQEILRLFRQGALPDVFDRNRSALRGNGLVALTEPLGLCNCLCGSILAICVLDRLGLVPTITLAQRPGHVWLFELAQNRLDPHAVVLETNTPKKTYENSSYREFYQYGSYYVFPHRAAVVEYVRFSVLKRLKGNVSLEDTVTFHSNVAADGLTQWYSVSHLLAHTLAVFAEARGPAAREEAAFALAPLWRSYSRQAERLLHEISTDDLFRQRHDLFKLFRLLQGAAAELDFWEETLMRLLTELDARQVIETVWDAQPIRTQELIRNETIRDRISVLEAVWQRHRHVFSSALFQDVAQCGDLFQKSVTVDTFRVLLQRTSPPWSQLCLDHALDVAAEDRLTDQVLVLLQDGRARPSGRAYDATMVRTLLHHDRRPPSSRLLLWLVEHGEEPAVRRLLQDTRLHITRDMAMEVFEAVSRDRSSSRKEALGELLFGDGRMVRHLNDETLDRYRERILGSRAWSRSDDGLDEESEMGEDMGEDEDDGERRSKKRKMGEEKRSKKRNMGEEKRSKKRDKKKKKPRQSWLRKTHNQDETITSKS